MSKSMKKVIDGKMYDTETAEAIAEDRRIYSDDKAGRNMTRIYKTQKGAFFLYACRQGASTVSNENIDVLTSDDALEKIKEWSSSNRIDGDATRKALEALGEKIEDA